MLRKNFPNRKEQRRLEAQERQKKRDNRTGQQQLELLRQRGAAGCKEYDRLTALLSVSSDS